MKQTLAVLASIVSVAYAQCDWSSVDQEACRNSNTQADCFPAGWPSCGNGSTGGGEGGQSIADILPASCNEVEFLKCFYEYPDLQNYLSCVHPEPCSCAGDFKVLECADAHCTDKSEYPEALTNNIAECRAKGKNTFVTNDGEGSDGENEDASQQDHANNEELRRRQNGPSGGLLTGDDVFPVGASCSEPSLTPCLNGLAQKYETCVDPFAPCLCSALFDIQRCYTASCTSQTDQPSIVTNNIVYCPKNNYAPGIAPPPPIAETTSTSTSTAFATTPTATISSTSTTVVTSTRRSPTATISPTGTITSLTTILLTAYLPTRSPLSPISPVSTVYPIFTISYTLISLSASTSSTDTYRQIELTSTTSTTTQVVAATAPSADANRVSTSTEIIPSTTVNVQTTTTSTVSSTGAAATMNAEMGLGAMAAAALGFAAML